MAWSDPVGKTSWTGGSRKYASPGSAVSNSPVAKPSVVPTPSKESSSGGGGGRSSSSPAVSSSPGGSRGRVVNSDGSVTNSYVDNSGNPYTVTSVPASGSASSQTSKAAASGFAEGFSGDKSYYVTGGGKLYGTSGFASRSAVREREDTIASVNAAYERNSAGGFYVGTPTGGFSTPFAQSSPIDTRMSVAPAMSPAPVIRREVSNAPTLFGRGKTTTYAVNPSMIQTQFLTGQAVPSYFSDYDKRKMPLYVEKNIPSKVGAVYLGSEAVTRAALVRSPGLIGGAYRGLSVAAGVGERGMNWWGVNVTPQLVAAEGREAARVRNFLTPTTQFTSEGGVSSAYARSPVEMIYPQVGVFREKATSAVTTFVVPRGDLIGNVGNVGVGVLQNYRDRPLTNAALTGVGFGFGRLSGVAAGRVALATSMGEKAGRGVRTFLGAERVGGVVLGGLGAVDVGSKAVAGDWRGVGGSAAGFVSFGAGYGLGRSSAFPSLSSGRIRGAVSVEQTSFAQATSSVGSEIPFVRQSPVTLRYKTEPTLWGRMFSSSVENTVVVRQKGGFERFERSGDVLRVFRQNAAGSEANIAFYNGGVFAGKVQRVPVVNGGGDIVFSGLASFGGREAVQVAPNAVAQFAGTGRNYQLTGSVGGRQVFGAALFEGRKASFSEAGRGSSKSFWSFFSRKRPDGFELESPGRSPLTRVQVGSASRVASQNFVATRNDAPEFVGTDLVDYLGVRRGRLASKGRLKTVTEQGTTFKGLFTVGERPSGFDLKVSKARNGRLLSEFYGRKESGRGRVGGRDQNGLVLEQTSKGSQVVSVRRLEGVKAPEKVSFGSQVFAPQKLASFNGLGFVGAGSVSRVLSRSVNVSRISPSVTPLSVSAVGVGTIGVPRITPIVTPSLKVTPITSTTPITRQVITPRTGTPFVPVSVPPMRVPEVPFNPVLGLGLPGASLGVGRGWGGVGGGVRGYRYAPSLTAVFKGFRGKKGGRGAVGVSPFNIRGI